MLLRSLIVTLLSLTLLACGSRDDEPRSSRRERRERAERERGEAEREAPGERPEGTGDDVTLVRGNRPLMSTIYQITVVSEDEPRARRAIEAALDEIERLEEVLSEWREGSEISRVNAAAGSGEAIPIGPDTLAVVRAGLEVSRWSEGAFDITWAALRGLYLFQRGDERVPTDAEIAERLPRVGYAGVILDAEASTLRLEREGMAIGTGGIAKGYAIDRAGEILTAAGFPDWMIFGGGQVQLHGQRGSRPWRVGVQHPRQPDYIGFVASSGGSISTSGDYEHFFVDPEGRRWHHIIDLATGRPATASVQVTVVAERGVYADALSTACFIRGAERCFEMLADVPGGAEAVVIDSELRVHLSPGLRDRFVMRVELDADGRLPR